MVLAGSCRCGSQGLAVLILSGVLSWEDVLKEKGAWNTLVWFAALVLAFFSNLWSSMTHYSTGPAPVFWGSDYVEMGTWWKVGFLISLVNIVVWLGVGGLWWKLLGLW